MAKTAVLELPDSSKLISRKIRVTEKFLRFSHCVHTSTTYVQIGTSLYLITSKEVLICMSRILICIVLFSK